MKYVLIASLLFGLAGCRKSHLGSEHARAYHGAFEAQRESEPERAPTFHAADAKATMAARRGKKDGGTSTTTTSSTGSLTVPVSTDGAWPGATGPITLEAK